MVEIIVGAVIAGLVGFVSSWLILRLQARSTVDLTFRLRALELQEPTLRWLSKELHGLMFMSRFSDADPLPRPKENSDDEPPDFVWDIWVKTGWAGAQKGVEILQAWMAEHQAVVADATVLARMEAFEDAHHKFFSAIRDLNESPRLEDWSEDATRRAQLAGAQFQRRAIEVKLAADKARGVR